MINWERYHYVPDATIQRLGQAADHTADALAYAAIKGGPNVFFAYGWDDTTPDVLYICAALPRECDGTKPSASDPLAQCPCNLNCPHTKADGDRHNCPFYRPVVLDVFVAQEELNIYPSARYQHMWGYDTDNQEEVVFD
jgi:hypothetical protein